MILGSALRYATVIHISMFYGKNNVLSQIIAIETNRGKDVYILLNCWLLIKTKWNSQYVPYQETKSDVNNQVPPKKSIS